MLEDAHETPSCQLGRRYLTGSGPGAAPGSRIRRERNSTFMTLSLDGPGPVLQAGGQR
jgi:hypothetical protein